jgi:hypothetical protein
MKRVVITAAALALASFRVATAREVSPSVRAPVTVEWVVRADDADRLDLTARVVFASPLPGAVTVTVTAPPGVVRLDGPATIDVVAPAQLGAVELRYRFAVQGTASGDLLLTADLQTPSFGVHAKARYSIGKLPATMSARRTGVDTSGPSVRLKGVDVGDSTPLKSP